MDLPRDERVAYAMADDGDKYRLCATSPTKTPVVDALVKAHEGEQLLVIGQYLDQLDEIAEHLDAPVIKGGTSVKERQRLFDAFRRGELQTLVVSKVANFSIDLPEATVAIQVSGIVRFPAGGSPAPGPAAAAQGGRPVGAVLHRGGAGHAGPGLRRQAAAFPGRAGLRLHHQGRQGRAAGVTPSPRPDVVAVTPAVLSAAVAAVAQRSRPLLYTCRKASSRASSKRP